MEDKEKPDSITITPKQVGVILAVILALASGLPIGVNKLTPQVRSDPFTGKDGDRLKSEIRRECQSSLSFIQSQIDEIKASDAELKNKYHAHSHEAPPRWVRDKLMGLEGEVQKAIQHVADHDAEANSWKHRIIALEAELQFRR